MAGVGWGGKGEATKATLCVRASERANELIPVVPALSSGLCFFIYFLFDAQHKPVSTFWQLPTFCFGSLTLYRANEVTVGGLGE